MTDGVEGVSPPRSLEAERAVLGAAIVDRAALDALTAGERRLRPSHFAWAAHQRIYAAMLAVYERDEPVDVLTTADELRDRGWVDAAGGAGYLVELADGVPSTKNAAFYAGIVWEKALRRALLERLPRLEALARNEDMPLDDVLCRVESDMAGVTSWRTAKVLDAGDVWARLEARLTDGTPAVPYHLEGFNRATAGGMREGLYTVWGGPTGRGKTRLLMGEVLSLLHRGHAQVVFSFEMGAEDLAAMAAAQLTRQPPDTVIHVDAGERDPFALYPGESEFEALGARFRGEWRKRLFVYEEGGLTVEDMAAIVRQHQARHGVAYCHIDFATLIENGGRTRAEEMEGVARKLAAMYKRHRLRGVVLTQVTEDRAGVAGSKYGRDLENMSQTAYLIQRTGELEQMAEEPEVTFLNRKNRFGRASGHTVKLRWNSRLAMYEDL